MMNKTQTILVNITGFSFDLIKDEIDIELSIQEQTYYTAIDKEVSIFHDSFFFRFFLKKLKVY